MDTKTTQITPGPWRVGDAGFTVFGPPNGNPAPEIIASVKNKANAEFIVRAVNNHEALLEALRGLTAEIQLGKLNVRKDFYLMNAHACALKAIHKATKGENDK